MFPYSSSSKALSCLPTTAAHILLAKAVKKVSTSRTENYAPPTAENASKSQGNMSGQRKEEMVG